MKTNKKPTIQEVMAKHKKDLADKMKEAQDLSDKYMQELQEIIKESEKGK